MTQYEYSVVIGRFQPFHLGHVELIEHALRHSEKVIIIVGSCDMPRTTKNPFTFEERYAFIESSLMKRIPNYFVRVEIVDSYDTLYNDISWVNRIQAIVSSLTRNSKKVVLVGHNKDDSSYYLKMFPQWSLIEAPNFSNISSTQIRDIYFSDNYSPLLLKSAVCYPVLNKLSEFKKTEEYQNLLEERKFIEKYKTQYASYPYPPTFITTDAVVVQSGHVLMVRRKASPGKGLLAFPGGFLDANNDKTIEDGMLRELKEETNIKVPVPVLRGSIKSSRVFDAIGRSLRGRTITHAYYIELPPGTLPKIKSGSDAESVSWIPISQVRRSECFEDHYEILNYFTGVEP